MCFNQLYIYFNELIHLYFQNLVTLAIYVFQPVDVNLFQQNLYLQKSITFFFLHFPKQKNSGRQITLNSLPASVVYKQFGPRSYWTIVMPDLESNLFDTMMVFLFLLFFVEKVIF